MANDGEGLEVNDKAEWNQEISECFKDGFPIEDTSWWINWWYLPTGTRRAGRGDDESPDFKTINEAVIRLADDDYRHELVRRSVRAIEKGILSKLK